MKVILLNGSPNPAGCTFTALSEVAQSLNQNGIDTEILQIGKKPIAGCIVCRACNRSGRCVPFDDMANILNEKIQAADGFVVGSPVYYAAPNGALLALLNRTFYCGNNFAHKVGAAVVSARRAGTTATLDVLNKYFSLSQMHVASSQYWNMVHGAEAEEVAQDTEGKQTMRVLGNNMAYLIKCLDAGKNAGINPPDMEPRMWTNFTRR